MLTMCFTDRRSGETNEGHSKRGCDFAEFAVACKPSPSGSPRVMRHIVRPRYRSEADRLLDPRLSILAEIHQLQS